MSSKRVFGSLAAACLALVSCMAHGANVTRPSVPGDLEPPSSQKPFLVAHAIGTQNYVCFVSATGVASWVQYGPQATLFDDRGGQIATHFLSVSPEEVPTARPTWQHSRDTSAVWGLSIASSTDPAYVSAGAIPWLLLRIVGTQDGPEDGDKLARATYIQRVNTQGGTAPSPTCSTVGARAFVAYETDYVFYRAR